jgi:long-chain acyl-CoA synthetase
MPIVIGDRQKFLAALIVPNFEKLKDWAAAGHRTVRWDAIDADSAVRALFQAEIDAYNADRPHHEQIRAFALLPSELTIEDGSVTPTLKVKRRTIETRYRDLIEGMYAAAGKSHVA